VNRERRQSGEFPARVRQLAGQIAAGSRNRRRPLPPTAAAELTRPPRWRDGARVDRDLGPPGPSRAWWSGDRTTGLTSRSPRGRTAVGHTLPCSPLELLEGLRTRATMAPPPGGVRRPAVADRGPRRSHPGPDLAELDRGASPQADRPRPGRRHPPARRPARREKGPAWPRSWQSPAPASPTSMGSDPWSQPGSWAAPHARRGFPPAAAYASY
jgi:hypothetical protein